MSEHNCVAILTDKLFKPRQAITYLPDGGVVTTPLQPGQRVDWSLLTAAERAALTRVDGFDVATREYVNKIAKETVDYILANVSPAGKGLTPRPAVTQMAQPAAPTPSMLYSVGVPIEGGVGFFSPAGVALPVGTKLVCAFLNMSRPAVTKHDVVRANLLTGESATVFSAPDAPGATTRSRRIKLGDAVAKDTVAAFSVSPHPADEAGQPVELSLQLVIQLPA